MNKPPFTASPVPGMTTEREPKDFLARANQAVFIGLFAAFLFVPLALLADGFWLRVLGIAGTIFATAIFLIGMDERAYVKVNS